MYNNSYAYKGLTREKGEREEFPFFISMYEVWDDIVQFDRWIFE